MGERDRKIFGKVRKIAVIGLAGCMLAGGSMEVFAATLKDVFDEHYYADTYPDLKEAYGYDREALWNHFITYGLSESRNMNEFLDVVKYREEYGDLEKAFGDDWDAYLNHYLTFGAKEGRDTGTAFNALDYAGRYEDLKEAFGDNVLGLWRHYQTFGKTENREARDERIVVAEREAARAAEEARKAEESQKTGYEVRKDLPDGMWIIHEYNSADQEIKKTSYQADGSLMYYIENEYDSAGNCIKETMYNADGSINSINMNEYDSAGNRIKKTMYNADGSINSITENEYDSAGNWIRSVSLTRVGSNLRVSFAAWWEYDNEGNEILYALYSQAASGVLISENGDYTNQTHIRCNMNTITSEPNKIPNEVEVELDDAGNQTKFVVHYNDKTIVFYDANK